MPLHYSQWNSKQVHLAKRLGIPRTHIVSFDLTAGQTCPFADKCMAWRSPLSGKLRKGPHTTFTCFSALTEVRFQRVWEHRYENYVRLKEHEGDVGKMIQILMHYLPPKAKYIRIHSSGDFFSRDYFNAWWWIAQHNPQLYLWGYTKGFDYAIEEKSDNFKLVYSWGGKNDDFCGGDRFNPPSCSVVFSEQEAADMGLPVVCKEVHDTDDFEHIRDGKSFAILAHPRQYYRSEGAK